MVKHGYDHCIFIDNPSQIQVTRGFNNNICYLNENNPLYYQLQRNNGNKDTIGIGITNNISIYNNIISGYGLAIQQYYGSSRTLAKS